MTHEPGREEPDLLTDEDEAILDRVWDAVAAKDAGDDEGDGDQSG